VTYVSALAELESLRQVAAPASRPMADPARAIKRILTPDDVQTVRGRGHWMAGVAILSITIALLGAQVAATKSAEKVSPTASNGRQSAPPEVPSAATPEARQESAVGVGSEEPGVVATTNCGQPRHRRRAAASLGSHAGCRREAIVPS
jgi:hypothetical protein